jgi:hypothetical protein
MEDFSEAAEKANNFKKFAKSEAEKKRRKRKVQVIWTQIPDVKDLVKAKFLKKEHYLDPEPEKVKKVII